MGLPDPIRIDGLKQFRRALKILDGDLPKRIKAIGNEAAQIVVDEAKPRVPLGPAKAGHARSSVRVASTGTAARVAAGGKKYPYFPWLDFGGRVGPNKSSKRPFLTEGRYVWSAFDDRRSDVEKVLLDGLDDLARAAGLRGK